MLIIVCIIVFVHVKKLCKAGLIDIVNNSFEKKKRQFKCFFLKKKQKKNLGNRFFTPIKNSLKAH